MEVEEMKQENIFQKLLYTYSDKDWHWAFDYSVRVSKKY